MNSLNLIGRACEQPSVKYVGQTNRPVAEFTLAYDDPFNKDPKTNKPKAYFFYVIIWGQKAEIAAQYIVKGQKIGITGRLVQETFTPQGQDKPVQKTRIVAETFDLLEKPASHNSGNTSNANTPPPDTTPDDSKLAEQDNIPF
jgi:single-strand DNA-binding protein